MGKPDLHSFSNLPGVRRRTLRGPLARSVTGMMMAISHYPIVAAAGDHGSITVWISDKGAYRAAFHRFHSVRGEDIFTSRAALRTWLKAWFPRMREAA